MVNEGQTDTSEVQSGPAPDTSDHAGPVNGSGADWDNLDIEAEIQALSGEKSEETEDAETQTETEAETEAETESEVLEDESEDEDEVEAQDDSEDEDESEPVQTPGKVYKAKLEDGSVVEIPDNAVFKLKENGKFRRVSFDELKRNHAGQVAWDEKIEKANKKLREAEDQASRQQEELDAINEFVSEMTQAATKGDVLEALGMLGQMVGQDPNQFQNTWTSAFEQLFNQLSQMSPEERRAFHLEKQNQALQNKMKRDKALAEKVKTAEEITGQLRQYKQQYDLDDDQLNQSFEALKKARNGQVKGMKVEEIVGLAIESRVLTNLNEAIEESGIKIDDDQKWEIFDHVKLEEFKGGTPLELGDYLDIIQAITSQNGTVTGKAAENLSRKVKKSGKAATPKKVKKSETNGLFDGKDSMEDVWDSLEKFV